MTICHGFEGGGAGTKSLIMGMLAGQELLRPFEAVRILHWGDLPPGVFGGFSDAGQAAAFDETIARVLPNIGWCALGFIVYLPYSESQTPEANFICQGLGVGNAAREMVRPPA